MNKVNLFFGLTIVAVIGCAQVYVQPAPQPQVIYVQPQAHTQAQPVYVQPQPVTQPVYVQPQPTPQPVYVQPQQPVYVQPQTQPVYVQPQPVYVQPQQPIYVTPPPPPHGDFHVKHHGNKGKSGGGSNWQSAGDFRAGDSASEVSIPKGKKECYIEVTFETVSFNTVVVRRGGNKQAVTLSKRCNKGERVTIPIDAAVTGLRVSAGGKGSYRVYCK